MPVQEEARRARLRVAWEAVWDRGEVAALDDLLAPDYVRRSHSASTAQNREEFAASVLAVRDAFPDLRTSIDDMLVDGDRVAVRWHSLGTHTGEFLGVPPTGRPVRVSGATFSRFDGDRIVEEWVTWDPRQLLSALGIIPLTVD
ncbi:ester cyclase [Saccharopolyspora rosea]|uniref:Ester cyclase n=1 Tax=Saccharopolyspora rosea TaxID=524884 RepID=A0ABW3G512_9PSEU|nr:ester cyclase [Saccharopolyspora rosea]